MDTLMGWPTADKADLWVRQTDRRISMLERRPTGGGDVHDAADITTGQLPPQRMPGPAPFIPAPLVNGWVNFSIYHHRAGYLKTSAGIVVLSGLIRDGTVTAGTTIFTLPVGYRPDHKIIACVVSNGNSGGLTIWPDGRVVTRTNLGNVYVSLDGIMFPAADPARVWTPITAFLNSYADYSVTTDATWPPVSYWVDPHGRVWWRGLLSRTAGGAPGAETAAFNIPAAIQVPRGFFFPTQAADVHAFGAISSQLIVGNSTSPLWMTLSSVRWVIASAVSYPSRYNKMPMPFNTWANFDPVNDTSWAQASYVAFPDNLVIMTGLLLGGTLDNHVTQLSPGFLPDTDQFKAFHEGGMGLGGIQIYPAVASGGFGRIDLVQTVDGAATSLIQPNALLVPRTGTLTSWYSLGSVAYVISS